MQTIQQKQLKAEEQKQNARMAKINEIFLRKHSVEQIEEDLWNLLMYTVSSEEFENMSNVTKGEYIYSIKSVIGLMGDIKRVNLELDIRKQLVNEEMEVENV